VGKRLTFIVLAGLSTMLFGTVTARDLSVADRVRAQEAIDRVYYQHQIGTTVPFEQAVSRAAIEAKVLKSLRLSLALERFWKVRVDGEALRLEMERIEHSTQFPERLREIYRALDDDPVVIQEVLARGALVERMARRFHAEDFEAGRSSWAEWDHFWAEVEGQLDSAKFRASDPDDDRASAQTLACLPDDSFDTSSTATPCFDVFASRAWTGSFAVYWGGSSQNSNQGGRYDPLLDTCTPTSTVNAPTARRFNSTTAAGQIVIVFGGNRGVGGNQTADDGGRYDPLLDSWLPVANDIGRWSHSALWTGQRLLIWGGRQQDFFAITAGRLYDPATNVWTDIASTNAPSSRYLPSTAWTGAKMIVWGGGYQPQFSSEILYNNGGIYDLNSNSWSPLSTVGAPPAAKGFQAFWTGSRMFVSYSSGRLFDPVSNTWSAASSTGAPSGNAFGVWSGRELIVLGTQASYRYDAALDTWRTATSSSSWTGAGNLWIGNGVLSWGTHPVLYVVDNDRDGLTQSCDNCPLHYNPTQSDFDHDSQGDVCDLNDGLIYIYSSDPNSRQWQSESGYTTWNSYRGSLAALRVSGLYTQAPGSNPLAARDCGLSDPYVLDPVVPSPGEVTFTLVTGVAGGVESSLGTDSAGVPRANASPCP